MNNAKITKMQDSIVVLDGMSDAKIYDVVRVGKNKLVGEIFKIEGDKAFVAMLEDMSGLRNDETCENTNDSLKVELGPGLVGNVFDPLQRPIEKDSFSAENKSCSPFDSEKEWDFAPCVSRGDKVKFGDVLGEVNETQSFKHKICVPYGIKGTVSEISSGKTKHEDTVALIIGANGEEYKITLSQKRSVREKYGVKATLSPDEQCFVGQRVIDSFYPLVKGTFNAVCGSTSSGKTTLCRQIAKFSNADVIVYLNCGERENDLSDTMREFSSFVDEKTGESLCKKTVFISAPSDMPHFSKVSSVYTASTIADYYTNMGYDVLLVVDSLSRFCAALSRTAESLYPISDHNSQEAYVIASLAKFFERARKIQPNGKDKAQASLSILATLSNEDKTLVAASKRFSSSFVMLDSDKANKRFYPAVNTEESFSDFLSKYPNFFGEEISNAKEKLLLALAVEEELSDLISFVGIEETPASDRLTHFLAKLVDSSFIKQNAFDEKDLFSSFEKQNLLLKLISFYSKKAQNAIESGVKIEKVISVSSKDDIEKFKYESDETTLERYEEIKNQIEKEFEDMLKKEEK